MFNGVMIISIASKKGGVGKTTTAVCLAGHLSKKHQVLLVDADTELQSSTEWLTAKEDYQWGFDHIGFEQFQQEFEKLSQKYDRIILDTKGGEDPEALVELAQNSNLLIIPTKPDGLSMRGLRRTLMPLIEQGISNYRVLITDAPPAPSADALEARLELQESEIPVFTHPIRRAVAVSKANLEGVKPNDVRGDRNAKLLWRDYEVITLEAEGILK